MASIEGKVINQQDGQPIAEARVEASEGSVERGENTAANGDFIIDSLNAGKYDLRVTKIGFEDGIYGPIAVVDDGPTQLLLALQPSAL